MNEVEDKIQHVVNTILQQLATLSSDDERREALANVMSREPWQGDTLEETGDISMADDDETLGEEEKKQSCQNQEKPVPKSKWDFQTPDARSGLDMEEEAIHHAFKVAKSVQYGNGN